MKLSKTAWIILGIGIFIIAFGTLYMVYSQRGNEQEQLNKNLSAAQSTLPKVTSEKETRESELTQLESHLAQLESQLATAESVLAESKVSFPESVESIEYDELLFKFADDWNLQITELAASEPENIDVEGIPYQITSVIVDVRGKEVESTFETQREVKTYIDETVDDILDLVNTIVTHKDFVPAFVEKVTIDIEQPTEEDLEELDEIDEKEMVAATIKLVIYSYQGE